IAEAPEDLAAIRARGLGPIAGRERLARGLDRQIHILRARLGDLCQDGAGGGVEGRERAPGGPVAPFAADEEPSRLHLGLGGCNHRSLLLIEWPAPGRSATTGEERV